MPDPAVRVQELVISDFSPGIRQVKSLNHPLGTADDTTGPRGYSTVGCIAGPDGVLKALPAGRAIPRDDAMVYAGQIGEQFRICGTFANDPVFSSNTVPGIDQNNTELFMGIEYYTNTNRIRKVLRYSRHETTPVWEVLATQSVAATFSATSRPGRCYFASSRSRSAAPTTPGVPVVGWSFAGWARAHPDDTAPTVAGTVALPQDGSGLLPPDLMTSHQNRFVIFPLFGWGDGNNGTAQVHPDNELIYWTTFNNYLTLDAAFGGTYGRVIAYPERDTGYEFVHSLSNDQLLAVKRAGGGLILQGNLNTFTAVPQPGIRSPGFSLNTGCLSHIGVVYPINASGVWVIEGGRQSRNLSPYMDPDFWRPRPYGPANPQTGPSYLQSANGWGVDYTSSAAWQEWVMLPSNWLFDTVTESWWRLDDMPLTDTGGTDLLGYLESHWWTVDWTGRWAWSSPSGYSDQSQVTGDCTAFIEYDKVATTKRSQFVWLSHPLPINGGRVVIDDIEITCEVFDTSTVTTASTVNVRVLTDDSAQSGTTNTSTSITLTPTTRATSTTVGAMQTIRGRGGFDVRGSTLRLVITSTAGYVNSTQVSEPPRIHKVKVRWHEITDRAVHSA